MVNSVYPDSVELTENGPNVINAFKTSHLEIWEPMLVQKQLYEFSNSQKHMRNILWNLLCIDFTVSPKEMNGVSC